MRTSFFHFSLFSCTDGFQGNVSRASDGLVILPVRVGDAPSHGNVQPMNLRGPAQSGRLLNYGHENIEARVREILNALCERVLEGNPSVAGRAGYLLVYGEGTAALIWFVNPLSPPLASTAATL